MKNTPAPKKKTESPLARLANPPRSTKARELGGPKIFGGPNISTQPIIFGGFDGPTRRIEPVLPSLDRTMGFLLGYLH